MDLKERYEEIYKDNRIILKYDHQDNQYLLYILDETLKRRLKANMLFSFDGKVYIKASGGRSIRIDELVRILGYPPIEC